jgi:hypothetical protein
MHKHMLSKHEAFENFKMHHNNQVQQHCSSEKSILNQPFKLLSAATIAGFIIGLLIR